MLLLYTWLELNWWVLGLQEELAMCGNGALVWPVGPVLLSLPLIIRCGPPSTPRLVSIAIQWTIIRANIVWHGIENKEASLHPHCFISGNHFCYTFSCWIPNIPLHWYLTCWSVNKWQTKLNILSSKWLYFHFAIVPACPTSLIRIHLTVDSWKKSKSCVWDQTHVGAFLMNYN